MNLRYNIFFLLMLVSELIVYIVQRITDRELDEFTLFPYAIVGLIWTLALVLYNHYSKGSEKDPEWEAYKKKREEEQQDVRRREALDEKLCSKHYTQAEKEYLIYTADLSTEQKNILRKKHLNQ